MLNRYCIIYVRLWLTLIFFNIREVFLYTLENTAIFKFNYKIVKCKPISIKAFSSQHIAETQTIQFLARKPVTVQSLLFCFGLFL